MTEGTLLRGLAGDNPLSFLAAVGTLEVAHRFAPQAGLAWSSGAVPRAVVHGCAISDLTEWIQQDAVDLLASPVLDWPRGNPVPDVKVTSGQLSEWAAVIARCPDWLVDQWSGLASEGGLDLGGKSKPTHLHFAAGQQRFLTMVRLLGDAVDSDRIVSTLTGPWRAESGLPSLGWDAGSERIFALRGGNPAKEERSSVPVADWLAFRGLSAYPTSTIAGKLVTAACDREWKSSAFRWPLWTGRLSRDMVHSVVTRRDLVGQAPSGRMPALAEPRVQRLLARQAVSRVYEAAIRRTDQGGYGSFAPPTVLFDAGFVR